MKNLQSYLMVFVFAGTTLATFAQNKALQFDGVNNHINIDEEETLIESNPDFTIEFWVKSTEASAGMIYCEGAESNNDMIRVFGSGGKLHFRSYIGNVNTQISSTGNNLFKAEAEWNHIAYVGVTNGGVTNLTLYINGTENNTGTYTRSTADWTRSTIGALTRTSSQGNANYNFNGSLDEFRMWTRALDAAEIAGNACLPSSANALMHHIRFDEGVGTSAADEVGNNVIYAVEGTPVWIEKTDCDNNFTAINDEAADEHVIIHPNPTSDRFYVRGNFKAEIERISLMSMSGQALCSVSGAHSMDVGSFERGFYLLKISCSGGKVFIKKVIIE